ncbi:MAG: hypothetical protein ABEI99_07655, partial [Halobaculum sp.]
DVDRETVRVNVHANNEKTRSVSALARGDHLSGDDELRTVETTQSMAESEAAVGEIRGVEELAVSGDLLEQAEDHRDRVDRIASDLAERLWTNEDRVAEHYRDYADELETALGKHVCEECLDERAAEIREQLNLVDQILSPEAGSLGTALSDEDLDQGADGAFTDQIRADIQEKIPQLEGELERAYNNLEDLGPDGGFCAVHDDVETVRIDDGGAVFGEVWSSLYYRFREPIMDSVEDLERDAEDIRQNKEQKMIDLAQYEQIKDDVQQRYHSVRTDYRAAQEIEETLE